MANVYWIEIVDGHEMVIWGRERMDEEWVGMVEEIESRHRVDC